MASAPYNPATAKNPAITPYRRNVKAPKRHERGNANEKNVEQPERHYKWIGSWYASSVRSVYVRAMTGKAPR